MTQRNMNLKEFDRVPRSPDAIFRLIKRLATNPPQEVVDRIRERIRERRKGMPRGASEAVLNTRMGY